MRYGSVCSGIEAATQAWHGLGWEPAFFSDIEKFPVAVLQHHYPDVPCHGDFTTIKDDEYGPIDLLAGGTPCQSFSVAGLRGGMDDERGNLALEFIRLAQRKRPQWLVWENVPGVLSSNGGRDFGSFLGALAEIGYGFAYRVLDAQYFGVAQRRRRVFVVGYLGDWRRAAAVLFERESLSGNPAPSREEGEKVASATTGGAGERGEVVGYIDSGNGGIEPNGVMGTLTAGSPSGGGRPLPAVAIACNEVAPAVTTGPPFSRTGNERVECEAIVPMQTVGALDTQCGLAQQAHQSFNSGHYVLEREVMGTLTARMVNALGSRDVEEGAVIPFSAYNQSVESEDVSQTAAARNDQDTASCVAGSLSVRRLTPTECERLQGFPDGFTQIPYRNKPAENCPDGPRYKALGNSMAVPVMRWIGERIQAVEAL